MRTAAGFYQRDVWCGRSLNCNRTIELAKKIKQNYHVEPVVHLTCLHYNRAEIDEFARILTAEGIQNVLALRGDRNPDLTEKMILSMHPTSFPI